MRVTILGRVGTTIISPEFYLLNEEVPKGTTVAEIEQGIANSTYTVQNLDDSTFEGTARVNVGAEEAIDLVITVSAAQKLQFKIPHTITSTWGNTDTVLVFDIIRIYPNGEKDVFVEGKIDVKRTITRG